MDDIFIYIVVVAALLLLAAAVLIVSHVRSWRTSQQVESEPEEFDYRRRQFRRRMQTSAMLGVLGVVVLVGYVLTVWLRSGWVATISGLAAIGLVGWIALLALADVWATKHHFGRQHDRCLIEQAKLRAEIRRIEAFRNNGKKDHTAREKKPEGP
jgi:hypothetical protein